MYEPLYCFPSGLACQLLFRLLGEGEVLTLNLNSKIGDCSRRNKTEIKIGSLTPQAFKGYGQVVELPQDPDKALVATEFIYFWGTSTGFCIEGGKVEIGVCTVRARDYVLTEMERHLRTSEIFIPVGRDLIFAVAPSRDLADPQDAP